MNCHNALEILESARPASGDLSEPELVEAAGHLENCSACRDVHRWREHLDRRIGRVMRDVPLPGGLRERLLSALALAESAFREPAAQQTFDNLPSECRPPAERPSRLASSVSEGKEISAGDSLHLSWADETAKENVISDELFERTAETAETFPAETGPFPQRLRRRWLSMLAGTVAALLLIAGLMFLWSPRSSGSPQLTLSDVRQQVQLQWERLETFDGSFPVAQPGGLWQYSRRLRLGSVVKGDLKGEDGRHRVALYRFAVRDKQGREFQGLLVVVPQRSLADPPPATFDIREERPENYARRDYGEFHTFAWTDEARGLVYICFVPAGEGHRKALEEVLSPEAA